MSKKTMSIIMLVIFITATAFLMAEVKVVKSTGRKVHEVKKVDMPKDYKKIEVNGEIYYVHHGVYYKTSRRGYKVVKAPKGAKIKHLPDGVKIIKRKNRNYYYFYHTWYIYDHKSDIYIVVDRPEYIEDDFVSDKLYMLNGSVLVGKFMGGSDDSVRFFFNDEVKRIPVEEIISIEFGASVE